MTSATLRLYALHGDRGGFDVSGVPDTSWLEDEITWNNAPAPGPGVVDSSGDFAAGSWVSVDVTPLVSGNGPVAVQLRSSEAWSPKRPPTGARPRSAKAFPLHTDPRSEPEAWDRRIR